MDKLYERVNWENEPSTKTPKSAENFNVMDAGIDSLEDRVIDEIDRIDTAISGIQGGGSGSSMNVTNLSGWSNKEEMQNEELLFNFNWSSGNQGNGTVIFDAEGKELLRQQVEQGDVSLHIDSVLQDVKTYPSKVVIIDSSGDIRIIPLQIRIKPNESWGKATDERISELLSLHKEGELDVRDYWDIGDVRYVGIGAMSKVEGAYEDRDDGNYPNPSFEPQTIGLALAHVGYQKDINGDDTIFVVQQHGQLNKDCTIPTSSRDAVWNMTFGETLRFQWLQTEYYNALPEYIRQNIREIERTYFGGDKSSAHKTVSAGKIHLLCRYNVDGNDNTHNYSNVYYKDGNEDNVRWDYFNDPNRPWGDSNSYPIGTARGISTSTPGRTSTWRTAVFSCVNKTDGWVLNADSLIQAGYNHGACGLAPFFCI